jgi:hypothetical protein
MRRNEDNAGKRCVHAPVWCRIAALALVLGAGDCAFAVTLAEKARESGCANKPTAVGGSTYRCVTGSGAFSYFNVPGAAEARPPDAGGAKAATMPTPTPSGFQRVDPATQKGRDDVRRKVLGEELATEEQLLTEARIAYANGAPVPLPEEQANAEKYRERIARYRQAVQLHERNIEALKKELGNTR